MKIGWNWDVRATYHGCSGSFYRTPAAQLGGKFTQFRAKRIKVPRCFVTSARSQACLLKAAANLVLNFIFENSPCHLKTVDDEFNIPEGSNNE